MATSHRGAVASPLVIPTNLAEYKTLADDALKAFKAGDLAGAKKKAKDLEKAWDTNSKEDLGKNKDLWKEIDTALDAYIDPLMKESAPDPKKVQGAYEDFIAKLKKAGKS